MAYDIFISYKESDGAQYAEKLKKGLTGKGYKSVYFNKTDKDEEGSFITRLENAIKTCKVFIFVLSENAKQSILNKTAEKGSKEFDYVCWELSRAREYSKHVLILNTGCSFDPYTDKYKYDDMKDIEIYTGRDCKSSLLEAQTFEMDKILDEQGDLLKSAGVDISLRMTLRRVIYGVLSLKYKAKNPAGNYVDKECIFNKQALEALCEYITKDNSITTEIENCATAEKLTEYMNNTNHEMLQGFCEHFEMEPGGKEQKAINIKIKDIAMCKLYEMDCWEVLEYLYNSYLMMNFHEDYASIRKFYLNKTISDYILALAWNRYFIKNKDKRRELVYKIIPELIRTHNHAQRYLFALIEKGRFESGDEWLFCDIGEEHSSQIKILFGEYYRDVFNTDMARSTFTERLFMWFNRNKDSFVDFCLQLIKKYKCSDAEIWNFLIVKCDTLANKNSLEILKGYFSEYVKQKNYKVIFRMIEQGLNKFVFFNGNQEKDQKLFDLLYGATTNREVVEKYGHGLAKAFYTFWKNDQHTEEIKQITYEKHLDKIVSFKNLYNIVEGITLENPGIPKKKFEEILRETVNESDDKILEDKQFLYVLNNIWVTDQNADLYNRAVSRLLDVCTYLNRYYGFTVLLFVRYGRKSFNEANRKRLFECIKDFADKYGADVKLEDKHYDKMFKILENHYFDDIRTDFKMKVFDNEGVAPETKLNIFNLWYDVGLKERLKEKIKENTDENNETQKAFKILFKAKNKRWKNLQGWKAVHLYPLIEELLDFENFVELKPDIQKNLIHNVKTKKEFYPKIKALLDSFKVNEYAWNSLSASVKIAFVMHINKIIEKFEEIDFINCFAESVIEDVASMRKRRGEVETEYGIREETLMYHMILLYRKKPWKTARLCAAAQVKWYGQLKYEDEKDDYNKKNMLFERRELFKTAVSNPCIKDLTCYLARANYSVVRQNSSEIANEPDVLKDFTTLFRNIIGGRIPLWFGAEVAAPIKTKMQWIENIDFESVVNDFKKRDSDQGKSLEDQILDAAQKGRDNFEEKAVDFEEEAEKIIVWKNSECDEKIYVLTRKRLFARYFDNSIWYEGLKFNAFLFIPQMCEEVSFVSTRDVFDVRVEIETVRKAIEEKFKYALVEFDPAKPKFDRFVKGCRIDKTVQEPINQFYNAYLNYLKLGAIKPEIAEAFSDYVRHMKRTIENMK